MAYLVRVLAANPDAPSLIPGVLLVEREDNSWDAVF